MSQLSALNEEADAINGLRRQCQEARVEHWAHERRHKTSKNKWAKPPAMRTIDIAVKDAIEILQDRTKIYRKTANNLCNLVGKGIAQVALKAKEEDVEETALHQSQEELAVGSSIKHQCIDAHCICTCLCLHYLWQRRVRL
jgi:hypothetical protein